MFTLERLMFALVLIASVTGAIISHQNLGWYEGVYVKEDGFIEWMTVLGLFTGAVACFYRISILKPFRGKLFLFCLFILGCLFLFGIGEEISWGQRIFDVKSSDFFLKNNSQGETNFHNLVVSGKKLNKIIFGTLLGIVIGFYFLIRKVAKVKKLIDSMAIPLPKYFHIAAYLLLVVITELIAGGKKGEILEFGGVWIFVLMSIRPFNREIFSRKSFDR
jgi:hypothetical protein